MTSPEQLGEQYLEVHHRMRRAFDGGMSTCGLTLTGTKVLVELERGGPVRPSVLAAEFGVAPRTITDVVDTLERDGLAVRQPDLADRRALLVGLTSDGRTALAAGREARARLMKQIFGVLDEADRTTLTRLLQALDTAAAAVISHY
jgi:DNA-binding MarR family transcriptional regulator